MQTHTFNFTAVLRQLEPELWLGEVLFLPEVVWADADADRLLASLRTATVRQLEELPLVALQRLAMNDAPAPGRVTFEIEATRTDSEETLPTWTAPIELGFDTAAWTQGQMRITYVPALGIEVISRLPEDPATGEVRTLADPAVVAQIEEQVISEIRFALARGRARLPAMVALQRDLSVAVRSLAVDVEIASPKERAAAERLGRRKKDEPELPRVGRKVDWLRRPQAYEVDALLEKMSAVLASRRSRSLLLVGPSGVGKTAAVMELIRQRGARKLAPHSFWFISGSQLVTGQSGFGMWQERCRRVIGEAVEQNAILHLGNLVELLQVGRSAYSSIGIASFLRPVLARGEIRAIAECTPEQIPLIEREDPRLLDAFARVDVSEPTPEATRQILLSVALEREHAPMSLEAVEMIDRLHRRYGTYSANPGRAVRFVRDLQAAGAASGPNRDRQGAEPASGHFVDHGRRGRDPERDAADSSSDDVLDDVESGVDGPASSRSQPGPEPVAPPIEVADVTAAFSRETGLPRVLLDAQMRLDPAAVSAWFAQRVIGQPDAVELVTDLLATAKAGLTRPRRPIASLLFIGPTGTGKTEMARTLAEWLFNDRHRLTRFDMSEYADGVAVQRLVGGVFGNEGQLTAKVREQPFSVLLFDEVEKAHPGFFDLLLQVLGEGRLTDAGGRLADFSNSLVIMTSNLGAASFRSGGTGFGAGTADEAREAVQHFTAEVQRFLRPEMFNRIDRIVPFLPLSEATVRGIAERELDLVRARDGLRYRGVQLQVDTGVAAHLAVAGYDPRYGARPLKRAVERQLLAPLAEELNDSSTTNSLNVRVRLVGERIDVVGGVRLQANGQPVPSSGASPGQYEQAIFAATLRRRQQTVERSATMLRLRNELYRLRERKRRADRMRVRRPESGGMSGDDEARLLQLDRLDTSCAELAVRLEQLEDDALLALYAGTADVDPAHEAAQERARNDQRDLIFDTFRATTPDAQHQKAVVAIYGDSTDAMAKLATAYLAAAATTDADGNLQNVGSVWIAAPIPTNDPRLELRVDNLGLPLAIVSTLRNANYTTVRTLLSHPATTLLDTLKGASRQCSPSCTGRTCACALAWTSRRCASNR
ncbi:MAG: AAA family ATPase [Planctomycetota bacterium]